MECKSMHRKAQYCTFEEKYESKDFILIISFLVLFFYLWENLTLNTLFSNKTLE